MSRKIAPRKKGKTHADRHSVCNILCTISFSSGNLQNYNFSKGDTRLEQAIELSQNVSGGLLSIDLYSYPKEDLFSFEN
jgi:hypothetical protein